MFKREVQFNPGYDHRETDKDKPWGNRRGRHGLNIRFLLTGDEGVVQFVFYTDWLPTWVHDSDTSWHPLELKPEPRSAEITSMYPMAADLGYHWPTPRYDDQDRMDCDLLHRGYCYYDGSGLNAERLLCLLIRDGHEAVWTAMQTYYEQVAEETTDASTE